MPLNQLIECPFNKQKVKYSELHVKLLLIEIITFFFSLCEDTTTEKTKFSD